ncbi:MAG TPA: DNA-binding protein [Burkholderiaceae bacterium]|jgi:predicted DNA-binding transcriptional regulator AlpA|nr:DNA-binding protein [Burkholderiaceae bacterium]
MEYLFTLKYQLSEQDSNQDDIVERLGAAGCDDALIGIGQPGRIALAFTREADSAQAALLSALADVKHVVPSASLIEAAPDFVGLTDVADVVGMTRQNMRKLMVNHATSFPPPVHDGSSAVWHLADVLKWLLARGPYRVAAGVAEMAETTKQVNLAKAAPALAPGMQRQLQGLLV